MDSQPMTWTIVDSCGLDLVPRSLANGRAFHAFRKLQIGSYGPSYASSSRLDHNPPGPLNSSFFPAHEHTLSATTYRNAFFESSVARSGALITTEDQ